MTSALGEEEIPYLDKSRGVGWIINSQMWARRRKGKIPGVVYTW